MHWAAAGAVAAADADGAAAIPINVVAVRSIPSATTVTRLRRPVPDCVTRRSALMTRCRSAGNLPPWMTRGAQLEPGTVADDGTLRAPGAADIPTPGCQSSDGHLGTNMTQCRLMAPSTPLGNLEINNRLRRTSGDPL